MSNHRKINTQQLGKIFKWLVIMTIVLPIIVLAVAVFLQCDASQRGVCVMFALYSEAPFILAGVALTIYGAIKMAFIRKSVKNKQREDVISKKELLECLCVSLLVILASVSFLFMSFGNVPVVIFGVSIGVLIIIALVKLFIFAYRKISVGLNNI